MTRLLYFSLLLLVLPAFSQRPGIKVMPVTSDTRCVYTINSFQQLLKPDGWDASANVAILRTLDDGYVIGTNEYKDPEKGQVFYSGKPQFIYGAYYWIGAIDGTDGLVTFSLRTYGNKPGRILAQRTLNMSSIQLARDPSGNLYIAFDQPVRVEGSFMMTMDVSQSEPGSIGLVSNPSASMPPMAWERRADQTWYPLQEGWKNLEASVSIGIFPVVSGITSFAGGSGTKADPYLVENADQLNLVRDFPQSHFLQIADIKLNIAPWSTGKGWNPIGGEGATMFAGTYDGSGFVITGLTINRPDQDYVGLFGQTYAATLVRITLDDAIVTGKDFTGALAGRMLEGSATEVQVTGEIHGQAYTGGMAGLCSSSLIDYCQAEGSVYGYNRVGGLAGSAVVEHCSSTGLVNGLNPAGNISFQIGGLLGEGFALNSHSSSTVSGTNEVGGLIGAGSAYGCKATGNVNGTGDNIGGLIGNLTIAQPETDADEYTPGDAVLPDTTTIRDTISHSGEGTVTVVLEDDTRVVFQGNNLPINVDVVRTDIDVDIDKYLPAWSDLRMTGSMRRMVIEGEGDPSAIKPIISIPIAEAGTIDPVTLVIMRVGDLYVNNVLQEDHAVILPVITVDDKELRFVDAVFPDCVIDTANLPGEPGFKQLDLRWVGEVRYFILSFDKSLNWAQRPVLERMIPDSTLESSGYRRLASKMSEGAQKLLLKNPICNVVLLIHGHNEIEKDGFVGSQIDAPWNFRYKRMVWDILYEQALKGVTEDYPVECTAFYEFISPTYRPIFSPVPDKTGFRHKTLGEDLGELVNEEFQNNPQLKAMIESDMPFNLYIVAHSQGGLVVRAGLRFMSESVLKHLKKVVTWGSPHHGAGLYSLRYALAVGHDIVIDGYKFPMQNIGQSQAYQSFVSGIAIDAPGIRDLRWDASKKGLMRLGDLLQENTTTLNEFVDTELPDGKLFYSDNLNLFNSNEGAFMGSYLIDKYMFYQGITPKDAPLEFSSSWNPFRKIIYFAAGASDIEKGAQLNKLVMHDPNKVSDGAGSLYSQGANAVGGNLNIQRRTFDDMDHEEFYGSEPPRRDESSMYRGRMVAHQTFTDWEFGGDRSACAEIESERNIAQDTLYLDGEVIYPIYDAMQGGDGLLGDRIVRMEARLGNKEGALIPSLKFTYKDDGKFTAKSAVAQLPISNDTIVIVAVFKDSSEVIGISSEALPWTICSIDFQIRFGEVEYTSFPYMYLDTQIVTIGHSTWTSGNDGNIGEFNGRTFEGHSENGLEHILVTLDPTGSKVEYFEFTLNAEYADITLTGHDIPKYEIYDNYFFIDADALTCNYISYLNYENSNEWGSFRLLSYHCADDLNYIHIFFDP